MYFERINSLRKDRKLKQADLAKLLHTTQEQYSRYECGDRYLPLHHLVTLAKLYDVSVDFILGLTDERTPYHPSGMRED